MDLSRYMAAFEYSPLFSTNQGFYLRRSPVGHIFQSRKKVLMSTEKISIGRESRLNITALGHLVIGRSGVASSPPPRTYIIWLTTV